MKLTDYRIRSIGMSLILIAGCEQSSNVTAPPTMTAGDEKQSETDSGDRSAPHVSEAAADGEHSIAPSERQAFDGLEFVVPTSWKKVALSRFQMGFISAKFEMPDAGPDITLTLSRSGGGLDANLDRWRGQMEASRPEQTETLTVAGTDATLIDMQGRFSGGFGRDPQDGWRMIGVIVPLPDQGYFMKLTGPLDQVESVEQEFRAFVQSAARE